MKNAIGLRPSGWLVFIIFSATLLALVYLLAGPAIRVGMVYSLEKSVGAADGTTFLIGRGDGSVSEVLRTVPAKLFYKSCQYPILCVRNFL